MRDVARMTCSFIFCLLALFPAFGAEKTEALYEASLDIDRDGKSDKAVIVLTGPGRSDFDELTRERYWLAETERADLWIYLGGGTDVTDLATRPDFIKKGLVNRERTPWIEPPKATAQGSLAISAAHQWGASKDWVEVLTIAFRKGDFVVAGYEMGWSWNSLLADGTFETLEGECEINFLTGKGTLAENGDGPKPLKGHFKPVKLKDWSDADRPRVCGFADD